jgi:hypothetical protein
VVGRSLQLAVAAGLVGQLPEICASLVGEGGQWAVGPAALISAPGAGVRPGPWKVGEAAQGTTCPVHLSRARLP